MFLSILPLIKNYFNNFYCGILGEAVGWMNCMISHLLISVLINNQK